MPTIMDYLEQITDCSNRNDWDKAFLILNELLASDNRYNAASIMLQFDIAKKSKNWAKVYDIAKEIIARVGTPGQ